MIETYFPIGKGIYVKQQKSFPLKENLNNLNIFVFYKKGLIMPKTPKIYKDIKK